MVDKREVAMALRSAVFGSITILLFGLLGVLDIDPVLKPVLFGVTGFLYAFTAVLAVLWMCGR